MAPPQQVRGDNVRARFYWILRRFATLDDGSKRGDNSRNNGFFRPWRQDDECGKQWTLSRYASQGEFIANLGLRACDGEHGNQGGYGDVGDRHFADSAS